MTGEINEWRRVNLGDKLREILGNPGGRKTPRHYCHEQVYKDTMAGHLCRVHGICEDKLQNLKKESKRMSDSGR